MDLAAIARFAQFSGAAGLFGVAVFLPAILRSAQNPPWAGPLMRIAALALLAGALLHALVQSAAMTGTPFLELRPSAVVLVLTETQWGMAMAVRLILALAVIAALYWPKASRLPFLFLPVMGGAIMASFAWTGHGAATEGVKGLLHLFADVLHLVAAGLWMGALFAFSCLAAARATERQAFATALRRFSGMGFFLVAVLIASGLVNSGFLIGYDGLKNLARTPYGILLLVKLALFSGMLCLAALNRFRLAPAYEAGEGALPALKRSLFLETGLGLAVLALVAVLGIMEPLR